MKIRCSDLTAYTLLIFAVWLLNFQPNFTVITYDNSPETDLEIQGIRRYTVSEMKGLHSITANQLDITSDFPKNIDLGSDFNCKDEASSAQCKLWAMNGECKINPEYMLRFCYRSCRGCLKEHIALTIKDTVM